MGALARTMIQKNFDEVGADILWDIKFLFMVVYGRSAVVQKHSGTTVLAVYLT